MSLSAQASVVLGGVEYNGRWYSENESDPGAGVNLTKAFWFTHQSLVLDDEPRNFPVADALGQFRGDPPMGNHIVGRKAAGLARFLQRDLRRENRPRIPQRHQNFCVGKPTDNRANVITVGRCFLHPACDRINRAPKRCRVRFHHEDQQLLVRVCWIECRGLKRLEKFLARKCRVIALSPFARPAEQHIRE